MIKKIGIGVVVLLAALFVLKKTNVLSYAGTLWCQVREETKRQVPTKFEIDRVRHELAGMDGDISKMLRPIAEHIAAINRLKKDLKCTRARLADQKDSILTMTKDLESNRSVLVYAGEEYSAARVRSKLQRDFDSYRRCEANVKSQEKLLDAKEQSLSAAREQLAKLVAKKREYEIRLAQLEADEETLQIARIGSKLPIEESNRATEIEAALSEIEHRHEVQRAEVELLNGPFANDFIPVQQRTHSGNGANLEEIRNYFQNGATKAPETTTVTQK
jgi:septation ring formation regulator EzrA